MIDKLLTRPLLVVTTFIKRHFLIVVIVLVLLWLSPKFFDALNKLLKTIFELADKLTSSLLTPIGWGKAAAEVTNKAVMGTGKALLWLQDNKWVLPVGLLPLAPLGGAVTGAWIALDKWKKNKAAGTAAGDTAAGAVDSVTRDILGGL